MFSWLFRKSSTSKKAIALFENPFSTVDYEQIPSTDRTELDRFGCVQLCSNRCEISNGTVFYEVIYIKERLFRFLVFHHISWKEAEEIFNCAKTTLNTLDPWFPNNKDVVAEHLSSIMECFRLNRNWTCAHVVARLGTFDGYFTGEIKPEELDAQIEPEMYTPLHLAIKNFHYSTVSLILSKGPNLHLVNFKNHSVLHYAAASTQAIAALMLTQDGLVDEILRKDDKGCTALHLACFSQKFDIVFEFLKFGLTVRMLTLTPPGSQRKSLSNEKNEASDETMKVVVNFSEQDFEDIDCQDIHCAGSPLHWTKHKRLMEKLIKYAFPLSSRNANGETALHVASRRLRLKCVICLLCAGCKVNAQNLFGNTALHLSVKEDDLVVPQTLIVFDANINAENHLQQSVRHVAAKSARNEAILYLLSGLGAKRCSQSKTSVKDGSKSSLTVSPCTSGCSSTGDFEGNVNERLFDVDLKYDRLFKDFLFRDILKQKQSRTPQEVAKEKGVNMLCLDGGGIKGLISVQMLIEVQKYLKRPLHSYFKWFSGTSTGSFICASLALGKSVDTIRSTYFRFKDRVFTGDKPYSSESLEAVITEAVGTEMKMEDILTKFGKYVIIPTVVANRRPMKLHKFRSFPSAKELFEESGKKNLVEQMLPDRDKDLNNYCKYESRKMEVWKACRASGAAPIYFRAYQNFLDGGLISNNPTMDTLTEFEHYNAALEAIGKGDQCQQLDLVLSIGTGKSLIESSEMVDIEKVCTQPKKANI